MKAQHKFYDAVGPVIACSRCGLVVGVVYSKTSGPHIAYFRPDYERLPSKMPPCKPETAVPARGVVEMAMRRADP